MRPFLEEGLSDKEVKRLMKLCYPSRQSILTDLSQLHGASNWLTAYSFAEKVVDSMMRTMGCKSLIQALELPPKHKKGDLLVVPSLSNHSGFDLVSKVYISVMGNFVERSNLGERIPGEVKRKNIPVIFNRFWHNNFLLFLKFVFTYAWLDGCGYQAALRHCAIVGNSLATTKAAMGCIIKAWTKGIRNLDDLEEYIEGLPVAAGEDAFKKWYDKLFIRQPDKDPVVDPGKAMEIFKRILKKQLAIEKQENKLSPLPRTRAAPNGNGWSRPDLPKPKGKGKGKGKSKQARHGPKLPPGVVSGTPVTTTSDDSTDDKNTVIEDPPEETPLERLTSIVQELPTFDVSTEVQPEDKWLILEVPYLESKDGKPPKPALVPGLQYAPLESQEIQIVVAIKVIAAFAYTAEKLEVLYHGQVTGLKMRDIESRCLRLSTPFTRVVPGPRKFSLARITPPLSNHLRPRTLPSRHRLRLSFRLPSAVQRRQR